MSQIMEKTLASLPKLLTQSLIGGKSVKSSGRQPPTQDLQAFLKFVHKARSKTHEASIVQGELSVMQQQLKQVEFSSSYTFLRTCFTKAIFCFLMGYDVHFVVIHAMKLAQRGKGFEKKLGYLLSSLLLPPGHEMAILMMGTLLSDLKSSNMGDNLAALSVSAQLVEVEHIPYLLPEILMKLKHSHELVREKAVHCINAFSLQAPALLHSSLPQVSALLTSRDPGVLTAVINIFVVITKENPSKYVGLGQSFLHILHQINNRGFGSSYYHRMVPLPWLQINLLRIMGHLSSVDSRLSSATAEALQTLIEKTKVTEPISLAVLVESLHTATKIGNNEPLLQLCSRCIAKLLSIDANKDMRYQGLGVLIALSRVKSSFAAQHQKAVVDCLGDNDPAIQLRTTQLLHAMANGANVKAICAKLFDQIDKAKDSVLENDVFTMISDLAEKYIEDINSYVKIYFKILVHSPSLALAEKYIGFVLARVGTWIENIDSVDLIGEGNLLTTLFNQLEDSQTPQQLSLLSMRLIGVLAVAFGNNFPVEKFLSVVQDFLLRTKDADRSEKAFKIPSPRRPVSDVKFIQSDCDKSVRMSCSCIDTLIRLVLAGCVDPQTVITWLEKHQNEISNPMVKCSLLELEELVLHPRDLPLRSSIMFKPECANIDVSLSFFDHLIARDSLQGANVQQPTYFQKSKHSGVQHDYASSANSQENVDTSVGENNYKLSVEETSSALISESLIQSTTMKNKWHEDFDEETFSGENQFEVLDVYDENEKMRQELTRELFAGLAIDDSGLGESQTQKANLKQDFTVSKIRRNIWDDSEDMEGSVGKSKGIGGLDLHIFGLPKRDKASKPSMWLDDETDTPSESDFSTSNFISYGSEQSHGQMDFDMDPYTTYSQQSSSNIYTDISAELYPTCASPPFSEPCATPSIYSEKHTILEEGFLNSTVDTLTDSDPDDVQPQN